MVTFENKHGETWTIILARFDRAIVRLSVWLSVTLVIYAKTVRDSETHFYRAACNADAV